MQGKRRKRKGEPKKAENRIKEEHKEDGATKMYEKTGGILFENKKATAKISGFLGNDLCGYP